MSSEIIQNWRFPFRFRLSAHSRTWVFLRHSMECNRHSFCNSQQLHHHNSLSILRCQMCRRLITLTSSSSNRTWITVSSARICREEACSIVTALTSPVVTLNRWGWIWTASDCWACLAVDISAKSFCRSTETLASISQSRHLRRATSSPETRSNRCSARREFSRSPTRCDIRSWSTYLHVSRPR